MYIYLYFSIISLLMFTKLFSLILRITVSSAEQFCFLLLRLVNIHLLLCSVNIHLLSRSVNIHLLLCSVNIHVLLRSVNIHVLLRSMNIHLLLRSMNTHLLLRSMNTHLFKICLEVSDCNVIRRHQFNLSY